MYFVARYCASTYGSNRRDPDSPRGDAGSLTLHLEPLIVKYSVDVVLSAHIHSYDRMWPVPLSSLPRWPNTGRTDR